MIPTLYITCVNEIFINNIEYDNIPIELDEFIDEYKRLYVDMNSFKIEFNYTSICRWAFYWNYSNIYNKFYNTDNILTTKEIQICRRINCKFNNIHQPISQFKITVNNIEKNMFMCKTCRNEMKC